ncbi:MAG: TIGR00159 family protein [Myxococcales bacterium]|nr:TIGR00159 family protein [Myxococcales bacterium]
MLDSLFRYFAERSGAQLARDVLDVVIVYYVFYRALLVLRGTRAMQVGVGLGMVFLLYIGAKVLQLVTVVSVLGALISSIILVIVVVFQNDIRRGLQRVGSRALFGGIGRAQETKLIDEVVEAATELARHRIGAIITLEQDANLDEFVGVHKGHILDAAVSRELLVSLFIPEGVNKLHDGSVVIRNYRIAKAGVFFPMPEGRVLDDSFGSRHRAALGITEETDAVVIVVSEERGTISFCFNGNIASNLDGPKLRTMLEAIFSPKARGKKRKTRRADAEAAASVAPSVGDRTRPPPSVRIAEVDAPADVDRPSGSIRGEQPAKDRDSEPPTPLRARAVPTEEGAARTSLITSSPTGRTPVPRAGMPRAAEKPLRATHSDDDEPDSGEDDGAEPSGGRS